MSLINVSDLNRKLWPYDFADLRRYGRNNDGGYVIPTSSFLAADSLLSFGINFDWSFEQDFAAAHPLAPIHAYDPTVGKWRFISSGFGALLGSICSRSARDRFRICCNYFRFFRLPIVHFHEWIGAGRGRLGLLASMARLPNSKKIGLKVDIEGSEYEIFQEVIAQAGRIEFLAIELHDIENHISEILDFTERMSPTHIIAHLHGNNHSPLCSNNSISSVIEVAYVRRPNSPMELFAGQLPRAGLDQPNNKKSADVVIRYN